MDFDLLLSQTSGQIPSPQARVADLSNLLIVSEGEFAALAAKAPGQESYWVVRLLSVWDHSKKTWRAVYSRCDYSGYLEYPIFYYPILANDFIGCAIGNSDGVRVKTPDDIDVDVIDLFGENMFPLNSCVAPGMIKTQQFFVRDKPNFPVLVVDEELILPWLKGGRVFKEVDKDYRSDAPATSECFVSKYKPMPVETT